MKNKVLYHLTLVMLGLQLTAFGQETTIYTEAQVHYKRGVDFFDKELYRLAQAEFDAASQRVTYPGEHNTEVLKTKSDLMSAISALRLEQPESEMKLYDFVRNNKPNPLVNQALYELGNYHYNARRYDEAADYFSQIESGGLTPEERAEVSFKTGYGYFVKKKFSQAKNIFAGIRKEKDVYYYPANYYYGMSSYFMNNYKDAIDGFRVASGSRRYKVQVPYYIVSIHFSQKEFDDVIRYGEQVLGESDVQKKPEIGQMVGQAYFERKQYDKALHYLNEFAERNKNLSAEEYYQVGYVNYMVGNHEKAIQFLRQASNDNSEIGQLANYYLADSYLKTNDKPGARSTFGRAANMKYRVDIQEDAQFQYAKLSAELNADKDAIQTLLLFKPESKYYTQAQEVISDVLINTRDFENAINIIESIPNLTPRLKEAYQKVTYNQGLKEFNNRKWDIATALMDKSLVYPVDGKIKAMATFWKAEIMHRKGDFAGSQKEFNNFFTLEKATNGLPDPNLIHLANYAQGFNLIKQNNYTSALTYFERAIDGIRKNLAKISDDYIKKNVLGDAIMRAGDCHFSRNRYRDASKYYNDAIDNKYTGYDYALFQKAIIAGLEKNNTSKIALLESLVNSLPNSPYAGDALYELGFTYEEVGNPAKSKDALIKLTKEYKGKSALVNQGYIKLGLLSYNNGKKEEALNYYKSIFQNNPTKQEADDALAAIEEIYVADLGKPEAYFKFLESIPGYAVKGDAKDSLTYRVAQVQYENGNYERAITAYTDYLQKYPKGGYVLQAYYNRGESYLILKNYQAALKDYESIIGRGQSSYYLRSLEKAAIISYNDASDFTKALDYYSKLLDVANNENIRFEAQLGAMRSAYRLNDNKKASQFAQALLNNSLASASHKGLAHFIIGKTRYDNKEWTPAIQSFNSSIQAVGDNVQAAEARYLIARIHFERKEYETAENKAKVVLAESAAFADWVAKSLILLSDIYLVQGDLIGARAALEAVIENFKGDSKILQEAKDKLKEVERREKGSNAKPSKNKDEIDFNEFNNN
jgi:tetratricopeptide (TPR) repeat protein